jgi:tRNA(Ile)-lysidine synthase
MTACSLLAPSTDAPIDEALFDSLLRVSVPRVPDTLALGVSGGPDSMALALCADRWARAHGRKTIAFIVDHRLRPESSDEAALVRARLAERGIEAIVLVWNHHAPSANHLVARQARYDLLADACRARGIDTLFLAHHADDQAETLLLRLAKGSGVTGLAGMRPVAVWNGLRLIRPFLGIRHARLAATCAAAGLATVHDPSNTKPKYARGRLRAILPLLANEGLTVERLIDLGERAREASEALTQMTDAFLAAHLSRDAFGVFRLADRAAWAALPRAIGLQALERALQQLAPHPYPLRRQSLVVLYDKLAGSAPQGAHSLGGCLVTRRERSLVFLREPAAVAPRTPLTAGVPLLWDNRFTLRLDAAGFWAAPPSPCLTPADLSTTPFDVRPAGFQTAAFWRDASPSLLKACPEGRARATLPTLWQNGAFVGLAHFLPCSGNKTPLENLSSDLPSSLT